MEAILILMKQCTNMDWLDNIGLDVPNDDYNEVLNVDDSDTQWQKDRLGKFTSSRIGALMTSGRGKDKYWGDTAMSYIYEKIAELMTGVPHYITESKAMDWGTDHEPIAIERYNEVTDNNAYHMGKMFIKFNEICGGSPDAFVGDDGILEVKCPYNSANHIRTYITGEVDKNYLYQCQGNMLFSDRKWCDFVSFDPRMPEELQLKIIRVERDEEICNAILERINKAAEEILKIQEQTGININIKF